MYLKVLIISANHEISPDPVYPLGACYIATACQNNQHQVKVFDCAFNDNIVPSLSGTLQSFSPHIIGISLRNVDNAEYPDYTFYLPFYKEIINCCRKNSNALLILGGSAYSLFPQQYNQELKPDYGIVGEGEKSFIELLQKLEKKSNIKQPPKIIYSNRLNIQDYPLKPNRELFNFQHYYDNGGMLNIQTKRGCAFHCSYCTYPYLEGFKLRKRKPNEVVDEIEYLRKTFNIKHFFFVDSVFNYPETHSNAICREIIKRKIKIKWSAYIRPSLKDSNTIELMKESGCKSIELGTDSMAQTTLQSLQKDLTIEDIIHFSSLCHQLDIEFCHSLIFGAPGETKESIQTTVDNVNKTNPTAVIAFIGIRMFPNTPLANYAVQSGYIDKKEDITLEPIFFLEPMIKDYVLDLLKEVLKTHNKWIIPGIEQLDIDFFQSLRQKKRRGMMWELKKFVDYF